MHKNYVVIDANVSGHRRAPQLAGTAVNKTHIPVNLLRKAQREARCRNETPAKKQRRHKRKANPDPERCQYDALVKATEAELKTLLAHTELLSDIPFDSTPDELLGELAVTKGHETTIYVQRDGLSTLTIVLPQEQPTIANLKRAIESSARVQLRRELRERHDERLRRRQGAVCAEHNTAEPNAEDVDGEVAPTAGLAALLTKQTKRPQQHQQRHIESTGELVCSTAYNGHRRHRTNVSWRFLWRAYALFNVDTNLPLNDQDARRTLTDCGIENAATLKFCHRVKYFGRKRQ